ncbi:Putative NAC domain transcription factor superfamily protein [Zea mays]|uniref:Putative NAC domain transcription factor superfamily protein n=2 Tax=Zea mays TaxID=4577 RepID=A0A1D6FBS1_MAIZE|nr:Putative NAC domain transcription factor superfamily protein [Zea mays]
MARAPGVRTPALSKRPSPAAPSRQRAVKNAGARSAPVASLPCWLWLLRPSHPIGLSPPLPSRSSQPSPDASSPPGVQSLPVLTRSLDRTPPGGALPPCFSGLLLAARRPAAPSWWFRGAPVGRDRPCGHPALSLRRGVPGSRGRLHSVCGIYCKMEVLRDMHLPPGFGFHPSDTELVSHYLKRKILGQKIEYDPIPEVDIYKHEPWDLPAKCNLPIEDNKWHFFASRDRKYPTGSRSNRATLAGYWKSTGKDRAIKLKKRTLGTKKTLVFHEGRPPSGRRTEWIMHEYYIDENECKVSPDMKDAFVLCRVTKRSDWELDNEVGNRYPHLEQLDAAAASVASTVKPEDAVATVICPEESNRAATPVGSDELSNDVGQEPITPDSSPPNGGKELEVWLEELLDPSPSFNLVADTRSADVSLTDQYAESSVSF